MDARLTAVIVIALGAGHWMVSAGLAKKALTRRRPNRKCPSCGRFRSDCSCVR